MWVESRTHWSQRYRGGGRVPCFFFYLFLSWCSSAFSKLNYLYPITPTTENHVCRVLTNLSQISTMWCHGGVMPCCFFILMRPSADGFLCPVGVKASVKRIKPTITELWFQHVKCIFKIRIYKLVYVLHNRTASLMCFSFSSLANGSTAICKNCHPVTLNSSLPDSEWRNFVKSVSAFHTSY